MRIKAVSICVMVALASASPSAANGFEFSGAGGFFVGSYSPDLKFLDQRLQTVTPGFDKVEGTVINWGGGGYGEVSENFRLGGLGFGGELVISGTFPHPNNAGVHINQDVSFDIGGGGFYGEWVAGHMFERWEGTITAAIGGYGSNIRITQYGGNVTWNDMTGSLTPGQSRETFIIEMTGGGLLFMPGLGLKFYATNFFAIEAHLDYLVTLQLGDWMINDVKVRGMPDVDLNAPMLGLRIMFGG